MLDHPPAARYQRGKQTHSNYTSPPSFLLVEQVHLRCHKILAKFPWGHKLASPRFKDRFTPNSIWGPITIEQKFQQHQESCLWPESLRSTQQSWPHYGSCRWQRLRWSLYYRIRRGGTFFLPRLRYSSSFIFIHSAAMTTSEAELLTCQHSSHPTGFSTATTPQHPLI